ncbi:LysR family transcriptional regulator [Ilumatobacter coccineus]|uniref:Putative LysR family transcriptional regulator n=1 Tax=Ilumatobacter coccineus (strain NBRC 103263 / KCTC 29153 / YM16-304) TaxID=1313172 RepID=A0A6C7EA26_ILUCY|nr:LysR family transcriptional regulator [Ilumatobacter coccineus]BAN02069.1 putative LysR family transcriptional regulator [Ilumatobacter coccineus YM16-304]
MDRRDIEYFLAVVDHGSFARAARSLRVSQPSVSDAVRKLERGLGVALFDRSSKGATPTATGIRMLAEAREIERKFQLLEHDARAETKTKRAHLHLALPGILAVHPMADLLSAFLAQRTEVDVRLSDPPTEQAVWEAVASGAADFGFVTQLRQPGFHSLFLGTHRLVAVFPPGTPPGLGPVDVDEFARSAWVSGPPRGFFSRQLVDEQVKARGLVQNRLVVTDHRQAIGPLTLKGAGPSLLNPIEAADLVARGAVVRPTTPVFERPYYVIYSDSADVDSDERRHFLAVASALVPEFDATHRSALEVCDGSL